MNPLPFFISIAPVIMCCETAAQTAHAPYSITVNIGNLQSDKGKVMMALYNSKETYMKTRFKDAIVVIGKNLKASAVFADIPGGNYAISIFHDENDNNELDSNRMRIPTEPYGFSNNARGLMGPASYDDASFKVQEDVEIRIDVK